MKGYHGKYLRVDLSGQRHEFVPLAEETLRQYLGGSGLGTWLLLHEKGSGIDPLSAEGMLAFVFSPLVGSPLTTSAKFAVVSKSPLTERINDSLASSGFAIAGKACGCDAIVVTGSAPERSILVIDNGEVRLESAGSIWGETCDVAQQSIGERLGPGWKIAVIGPAGEAQVRYATISHEGRHAGRGGSGAVMGAKNLKAIAVRGNQRCEWASPDQLIELAKEISRKSLGSATEKYRELGTASNLLAFNRLKVLPTRNFQQSSFEGGDRLAPETLSEVRSKTRSSCVACTIGCEHIYSLSEGGEDSADPGVRLEYENLFALGPLCGVDDPDAVLAASRRCDELGIDTISAGGTIAFAMECVDRGLLDAPWLRFGDGGALLRALDLIGSREEGLGDQLAEGSRRLARKIGQNSIAFAPQVKGLELPGYEPRALQSMAVGFAVGARGADHNRSGAYEVDFSDRVDRRSLAPGDVKHAIETEDKAALMDSLILCKFLRGVFVDFFAESAEILRWVTGWDISADELKTTAKRIVTAKKRFNIEAGWRPEEDTLPERFLTESLPRDDRAVLSSARLASLVEAYNVGRGWRADGYLEEEVPARPDRSGIRSVE